MQTRDFHELDRIIAEYIGRSISYSNQKKQTPSYLESLSQKDETIVVIDICHAELLRVLVNAETSYKSVIQDFEDISSQVFCKDAHGEEWQRIDNRRVYLYSNPLRAGLASLSFLEHLKYLNKRNEVLRYTPLFARIGIDINYSEEQIKNLPLDKRKMNEVKELAFVLKLLEDCPTGRISISNAIYKRLDPIERLFRPTVTEPNCFILEHRALNPQEEKLAGNFSPKQKDAIPALCFLNWEYLKPEMTLQGLRNNITNEKWSVVLGETRVQEGTFTTAATSDTVGLLEALTSLDKLDLKAGIDEWQDTADLVTDRNVIVVGSGTMNLYAALLNHVIEPLRFTMPRDGGQTTEPIVAGGLRNNTLFGSHHRGTRDSGFIVIAKSLFNLDKNVVWIGGISGMATQAILAFFRDLLAGTATVDDNAIGCVITPHISEDHNVDLSDYYRKWRISSYQVIHQVDADGNELRNL